MAEVRDLTAVRDEQGRITALPELERIARQAFESVSAFQSRLRSRERLHWNRVMLYVWPVMEFEPDEARPVIARLGRMTVGLGLEMVLLKVRVAATADAPSARRCCASSTPPAAAWSPRSTRRRPSRCSRSTKAPSGSCRRGGGGCAPGGDPHRAGARAAGARQRDPARRFVEHDLDEHGELVEVNRPRATNKASIVVGLVSNRTERYPEGMLRVILLGDPTRSLGSLEEAECRRVIAALDLAESLEVPCEWFALSAGAKIAMDSGTENMDWVAAALRRIVRFTQAGGELNVVVSGINVGAQPYWNAEATMLMHTKGVLIMAPESAMVLTGKQALDYSGGVSAEDNFGIGGQDRIMGPNGQAQYRAGDIAGACEILLEYYEHAYVAPGRALPAARHHHRSVRPRCRSVAARAARHRPRDRRPDLLPGDQPRAQEAV